MSSNSKCNRDNINENVFADIDVNKKQAKFYFER